jgi:hypothetical protein
VSRVPSAKKKAEDARRLAKLMLRIKMNLKARQTKKTGRRKLWSVGPAAC